MTSSRPSGCSGSWHPYSGRASRNHRGWIPEAAGPTTTSPTCSSTRTRRKPHGATVKRQTSADAAVGRYGCGRLRQVSMVIVGRRLTPDELRRLQSDTSLTLELLDADDPTQEL